MAPKAQALAVLKPGICLRSVFEHTAPQAFFRSCSSEWEPGWVFTPFNTWQNSPQRAPDSSHTLSWITVSPVMCQGEAQPTKDWMFPSKQFWKKNTRNCTELAQPFRELIRERTRWFYYFVHIGRREWGAFQDIPSGIKDFSPIAHASWLLSSLKLCGYMLGTCHPWFVSVFPCGHLCPNPPLSESFVASGLQPEERANFHQTAAPHGLQAIYLTGVNMEGTRPWELPGVGG